MLSERIRDAIRAGVRENESEDDLETLVEILADARAKARGDRRSSDDERFAATVLCMIFDPVKQKTYQNDIYNLRREYAGIAGDDDLKRIFRESLFPELLTHPKASDAIRRGADALFQLPLKGAGV